VQGGRKLTALFVREEASWRKRHSADFATNSPDWAENTIKKVTLAKLDIIAARLFDESEGCSRWNYQFTSFSPCERGGGYDVFLCAADADDASPECLRQIQR
jgi:hypothetical protein